MSIGAQQGEDNYVILPLKFAMRNKSNTSSFLLGGRFNQPIGEIREIRSISEISLVN